MHDKLIAQYRLCCLTVISASLLIAIPSYLYSKPLSALTALTTLSIEKIELDGIIINNIKSVLDTSNEDLNYELKIESLLFVDKPYRVNNIILKCKKGFFALTKIECSDGKVSFDNSLVSAKNAPILFSRLSNGQIEFHIKELKIANGSSFVSGSIDKDRWHAELISKDISLAKLQEINPTLISYSPVGQLDANIFIDGDRKNLTSISGTVVTKDVNFTNKESTIVGEDVFTKLVFQSNNSGDFWNNEFYTTFFAGQVYIDPIFIDAAQSSKELFGSCEWEQDTNTLKLSPITFLDQNSIQVSVNTTQTITSDGPTQPIAIDIIYANFPQAYDTYLQPLLLETKYSDLAVTGTAKGSATLIGNDVKDLKFSVNHVTIEDQLNRFAVLDLDGLISWGAKHEGQVSQLSFNTAKLYKLGLGPSVFEFTNHGNELVLSKPTSVPILDGEIRIESFNVNQPGNENRSIDMDVSLQPVSMKGISENFGWPELSGTLSGYAPNVLYKDGNIDVQGALLVRAFDGTTTIHNLQAKDLFSPTPKLFADIQIKNLDLQPLTEAFSFGEITGKLEGYIKDLQLLSWSPIHFDAWLGTPKRDTSRHRISQTAVDNLTKVGNGASNIFSKSFLQFLDSFGYDRIGIGCTLENSTCSMKGVAVADNGFYIVKGKGIPRIDIIGFTDQVSWPVLTERLNRIINTQQAN